MVKKSFYPVLVYKTAYSTQWITAAANFYWALTRFWTLAQHLIRYSELSVYWLQNFCIHCLCRRAGNSVWTKRREAWASGGFAVSGSLPLWSAFLPGLLHHLAACQDGAGQIWVLSSSEGVPKLTFVFLFFSRMFMSQTACRWSIRMSYLQNNLFLKTV